jgi:PhnB protein
MAAAPLPPGYHSVNPYFVVRDVERFIAFLVEVLGGAEVGDREITADGVIDHADVLVGDSLIMMSEASAKYPARPSVSFAYVDDVDITYARALAACSTSILAPTDQPWGDRVAGIVDPFDNRWWLATHGGQPD